jgi:hypothetical protein
MPSPKIAEKTGVVKYYLKIVVAFGHNGPIVKGAKC